MVQQLPNMRKVTRDKAKEHEVIDITQHYAFVEGLTSTYEVNFRTLTCSCKAGMVHLHCSHVYSALTERARMSGFDHVTLGRDQDHADSWARLQEARGMRTRVHVTNGWYIVEYGKQTRPAVSPPPQARYTSEDLYAD